MKKQKIGILTIILTSLLFSFASKGQDKHVETLKGKVKFITIFGYEAAEKQGEAPIDKLITKTTFEYDGKGNLIETNHYDLKDNVVFSKEKRVNDINGNLLEITFYNKVGDVTSKYVYKYDNKNNEIEKITYWKGRFDGKVITTYDYKSMIVKVEIFKADGSIDSKSSYKIDVKGNHLEEYNSDGKIESKTSFIYDDTDRIIKEYWEAWEEDNTKGIIQYEYDEWSNEVKYINFDIDGKTIISTNSTEYVYDKIGNWIKSVKTYSYNNIRETEKREIEYY